MSYILWNPALLDNPAFCALMAESPEYLGLWFRCLQIASAAGQEGELRVFGGKPLAPKSLALAHFRSAQPEPLELAAGFLELAQELGLLDLVDGVLVVAWWSDFHKELSETRDAWRQRKANQRARGRSPQPAPEQASVTQPEPARDVSRDRPVTVTESPEPNNQTTKQPNKQSINQSSARGNGRPADPPPEVAATLERFRQANAAAGALDARPP